jgi:quinol monooxygenase YgiN
LGRFKRHSQRVFSSLSDVDRSENSVLGGCGASYNFQPWPVLGGFNLARTYFYRGAFCSAERRALVIIVKITMNVLPEKQLEVMQTLLSMIGPTGKETGCLSYAVFCDIEDKSLFSLLEEWETREDLDHHIRSHRFGVLLGTKALLCEPPKIHIHTVSKSEGMEVIHATRDKRN